MRARSRRSSRLCERVVEGAQQPHALRRVARRLRRCGALESERTRRSGSAMRPCATRRRLPGTFWSARWLLASQEGTDSTRHAPQFDPTLARLARSLDSESGPVRAFARDGSSPKMRELVCTALRDIWTRRVATWPQSCWSTASRSARCWGRQAYASTSMLTTSLFSSFSVSTLPSSSTSPSSVHPATALSPHHARTLRLCRAACVRRPSARSVPDLRRLQLPGLHQRLFERGRPTRDKAKWRCLAAGLRCPLHRRVLHVFGPCAMRERRTDGASSSSADCAYKTTRRPTRSAMAAATVPTAACSFRPLQSPRASIVLPGAWPHRPRPLIDQHRLDHDHGYLPGLHRRRRHQPGRQDVRARRVGPAGQQAPPRRSLGPRRRARARGSAPSGWRRAGVGPLSLRSSSPVRSLSTLMFAVIGPASLSRASSIVLLVCGLRCR